MTNNSELRMPAEWEEHAATWIAWPHAECDWPEKFEVIPWVYAEIVRVLADAEPVHILCNNPEALGKVRSILQCNHVNPERYQLTVQSTDRSWVHDSAPTAVYDRSGTVQWIEWQFRAWAKYENYTNDALVPSMVSKTSGAQLLRAIHNDVRVTLEGGAIDVDGAGTMLTTEECLLSDVQERNVGFTRADYEKIFARYLGIRHTIWLGRGCAGDDTHGHVDDIARFVSPGKVLLAYESDPNDENFEPSVDNLKRLEAAVDASGRRLEVGKLPMPRPIYFGEERLPASYANFYIANGTVLVPTFNDPNDIAALETIVRAFPGRRIVGINCVDLVLGQGTLHCLTQQQPVSQQPVSQQPVSEEKKQ